MEKRIGKSRSFVILKKGEPSLSDKMEIADKWIQLGYTAKMVLRIVGILEATYYYRKNKASQKPRVYHGGRPIPGYSLSMDGQPVSDGQIKEWLSELIADEEAAYGYRKLTVCLRRDHQLMMSLWTIVELGGHFYLTEDHQTEKLQKIKESRLKILISMRML